MKRISSLTQGLAYLGLLAALILALVAAFRATSGGPAPAATAPADTPSPLPEETLEPTPTYLPIPTVFNPTPWPEGFTPAPTIVPTATPSDVPYLITDTVNGFSLTVLPGWYAFTPATNALAGATTITNFDTAQMANVHEFPPGGLKIQIGTGELHAGQTFEQWLLEWIALETSEEIAGPGAAASEPLPYELGEYSGKTFTITGPFPTIMEIDLALDDGRVVSIGLTPADSPALAEALAILSTLEILSKPAKISESSTDMSR